MAPRFSKTGKRLGRPPKNASKATPVVFSINTPIPQPVQEEPAPEPIAFDPATMIECEFVPIAKSSLYENDTSEKKLGIYSGSKFAGIEDLDFKKWVVVAYLKADFKKYRETGLNNSQILKACVNYLNAVEPRKKYAKKDPVPKYGKIDLFKEDVQFVEKNGHECAVLIFTTDQRRCDFFWGEGDKSL